jgi:hypothetical protein
MTPLYQWAQRHNISAVALTDLLHTLGLSSPPEITATIVTSEAAVQQSVRLEAARRGARMFRNNCGVAKDDSGRVVRFGLANDSQATNKVCKSSDLIGVTPIVCGCGHKYGIFTAYEVKKSSWKFTPSDERAHAQWNFLKLIVSLGGIGRFVQSVDDI